MTEDTHPSDRQPRPEGSAKSETVFVTSAGGDGRQKQARCHAMAEQRLAPVDIAVPDWEAFSNRTRFRPLGHSQLAMIESGACQVSMTAEQASQPANTGLHVHHCLEGELMFEQGGYSVHVKAGDTFFAGANRVQRISAPGRHTLLVVPLDRKTGNLGNLLDANPVPQILSSKRPLGAVANHLLKASWTQFRHLDTVAGKSLLLSIATLMADGLAELSPGSERATSHAKSMHSRARMLVLKNFGDPRFTPKVLADQLGVSPRYLSSLFQPFGRTPGDYIQHMRVHVAWDRLTDIRHRVPIEQVARDAGFSQAAYFARTIKAAYGRTPREIRRLALASEGYVERKTPSL